jgi:hypothetical protein
MKGFKIIPPLPINSGLVREGYEGLLVQLQVMPTHFERRSRHFWVDDGTGLAYIYVFGGTRIRRSGIIQDAPMTIVGIASQRTKSNPPFDGYRVLPRSQDDIIQHLPPEPPEPPAVPDDWPSLLPETGDLSSD